MFFNAYALILIISAIIMFGLTPLVWHRRQVPGAQWFLLMLAAVGEWCLTYAFEILAESPSVKLLFIKFEYLGIVSLAPLWLMFSLTYTGRDKWSSRWYKYIIWIIPCLTVLSVLTNNYHHIHYTSITYSSQIPGYQLVLTHGPGFYFFTAYSYILLLIGTIALVWAIINFPRIYRKQSAAIMIGALIPWVVNFNYITNITSGYDPTPLAFSISSFIFFWSLFRLDLFSVTPVAREMVIESMRDGMLVLDSQNLIADINPAASRIIGINHPAQAIGHHAYEILSKFPEYVHKYGNVFETKEELRVNLPNTDEYFELEINPITLQNGTIAGRIVILRNVTQRKQTEEALKKSEVLYHTLIETLPIAIFQKDLNSIYTFANQLYAKNVGIPSEKIIGKTDIDLHPAEMASLYRSSDDEIFRTGIPMEIEEYQELANGKRIPVHVIKTPLLNASGTIIGIQGIYWDTTQILQATREAHDRLNELTTVYAISQAAAQLEMDSLLTVVGENILQTFKVQSVFIVRYEQGNSTISIPYMMVNGKRLTIPDQPFGKGFTSEVIRTGQPLVVNSDLEKHSKEFGAKLFAVTEMGFPRSWMGVPMIVADKVVGAICMQDYENENSFEESDIRLFGTIASNVGIALKNADLYQEIQNELKERKLAESDLADSQSRLQAILDNAGAGIGVTREDCKFIFVNDRCVEMFGYMPQELSKMTLWDVGHPDDAPVIQESLEALTSGRLDNFQIEKRFINKDGSTFWGTVAAKAIRSANGVLENIIIIISDITLLKSTEAELINANRLLVTQLEEISILRDRLREQAIRDPLTNLYNRRFMEETLTLEIHRARRANSTVSLVMMDIDHFKLVNDQFGHKTGDHLLESLGQMLLKNTRKSDVACRYGGEEFLIVLPGSSLEDAARRAEQFRANFEAIRISGKNTITNATMSIGVACFPNHGEDVDQVLNRADEALYQAKAAGRNCVVVYSPSDK
jgi:diguanylate cyclase (GGDEF)-like protein/PAS domain S-box-containing protein